VSARELDGFFGRLEARVAERTLALKAADAAKTRFLAAASHDLRQPMQSILLFAGALGPHVTGDAGQRAILEFVGGNEAAAPQSPRLEAARR
jgi:signal transduction histidine kinase